MIICAKLLSNPTMQEKSYETDKILEHTNEQTHAHKHTHKRALDDYLCQTIIKSHDAGKKL